MHGIIAVYGAMPAYRSLAVVDSLSVCVVCWRAPEWSKMAANIAKTSTSTLNNPDKYALSEYTQHLDNSQQEQY